MKAFLSIDLEGMPYVVIPGHLNLKGSLYSEARKIATRITLTVTDELAKNGVDQVVIADSHGPMVNLLIEDLPENVEVIRGYPRPLAMITGVEGCDFSLFLGYHAKFGTASSTFDHTYSGAIIASFKLNGIEVSEFLLNAYAVGENYIPVILAAGENQLIQNDVIKYTPWVKGITLKTSYSRVSAKSPSLIRLEKELREGVQQALNSYKKNLCKPLRAQKPVKMEITFQSSNFADMAELLPIVKRINGLTVECVVTNVLEAYKIFELLVLAAHGVSGILTKLM